MSSLSTLPKGDSAWLLRKAVQRIMQQVSVLETNIGSSTTGNSANTQVIFNDAGTLRGDAGLTYNAATDTLTAGAATITGDLTVRTNKLKVDASGVGIGTASPAYAADVSVATTDGLRVKNTLATSAYFNRFHISNDTGINFIGYGPSYGGGTILGLGAGSNSIFSDAAAPFGIATTVNQPLVFGINGSTAMTLNASGNLVFPSAKGIDFSAVTGGTGTATGNVLNDYEEGTFTVGIAFGGASVGVVYAQQIGIYTKVGRIVHFSGRVDLSNKGSSTGEATITGLPFNASLGAASVGYQLSAAPSGAQVMLTLSGTVITVRYATGTTTAESTDANFANNSIIIYGGTYAI